MANYLKTHQACPSCGSSDAMVYNEDGTTHCYSCNKHTRAENVESFPDTKKVRPKMVSVAPESRGTCVALEDRGISKNTCEAYNVTVKNRHQYYPYYDVDGDYVGSKIRLYREDGSKDFTQSKSKEHDRRTLFGQINFSSGGKYVTLCEGEIDALSAYQMMGSKWTCLSLINGAQSVIGDIKRSYDYLMSFEQIVLCFDNDEAGRKATKLASEYLSPKAKVMNLKFKDANEYLMNNKQDQFYSDWWAAEEYRPEGIVRGTELWDILNEEEPVTACKYPYTKLNEKTYGIRMGELVTVCAGTGIGKSTFIREVIKYVFDNTSDNIGMMFMEESIRSTSKSMMSLDLSTPLHLPSSRYTRKDKEYKDAFLRTVGSGRYYFFNHFGSNSIDNLLARIRYFVKVGECKYIVIDHISILVSSQEHAYDERRTIDECMTKLRTLVQELNFSLIIVSHLRRPAQGSHEEGRSTSLSDLRGSASIGQLSDIVIGLERDGQEDDFTERHTTKVRVLKNRFSGDTGLCDDVFYDKISGRMRLTKDNGDCL